ncbi:MAG TPA: hypothetical protein PKL30_05355 [Leptospiraceae bacterium]|nr:hypothetical protein [Leptospiraceae bacterium]HMY32650.1 hypothetical protein [Leptospiraceae bacterium]HNE10938.1 hypothetical protein [Leptospiraceae bacterium]HNF57900.1 hypothetical protein [Leptospiraceae bacterium]HNH02645.1 hypothetical protein [Leptospiraceae bacterium]
MKNLILENYDSLKESNYIRKTEPKSRYWGDFSYNKMEKFKTASNGNFNLIIYGDANKLDDYYIIPYSKLKDKLIEKSFSRDRDVATRKRWIFTIDNHNLKISNDEGTVDIKE